jgi:hypothetical protein
LKAPQKRNDLDEFWNDLSNVENEVLSGLAHSVDSAFEPTPETMQEARTDLFCQWWNEEMTTLNELFAPGLEELFSSEISTLFGRNRSRISGLHCVACIICGYSIQSLWDLVRSCGPLAATGWRPDRPFVHELAHTLRRFRVFDFPCFEILFCLLRMPPLSPDLHPIFVKMRRLISDELVPGRLDPEISLVHRFAVLFGSRFPVSRGVFANSFTDFVFGSLVDAEWQYLDDDGTMTSDIPDFPRSATSESGGQKLIFYPKTTRGVNGGLKIEWIGADQHWTFFSKLCHCPLDRPNPPDTMGRLMAFGRSFQPHSSYTTPGSSHVGQMALDFREIAIYMLMEAVGIGARVIFFIDTYCAGSFHILTEEVENAIFPTTDDERAMYKNRYLQNSDEFLEAFLIVHILGLRDCHANNFCCTTATESSSLSQAAKSPTDHCKSFPLKIIDFVAPEAEQEPEFPECDRGCTAVWDSPLLSGALPRYAQLGPALESAIVRLGQLSPPNFRLAIYPRRDDWPDFASLVNSDGVVLNDGSGGISYSEFLAQFERQLRDNLFKRRVDGEPFRGRTLAELFGLTDTENIWEGEEFDRAITAANQDESIVKFNPFFDAVFKSMEGKSPPTNPVDTANKSVNYALTMLRWFGIWIERRIANMREYFDQGIREGLDALIFDESEIADAVDESSS